MPKFRLINKPWVWALIFFGPITAYGVFLWCKAWNRIREARRNKTAAEV